MNAADPLSFGQLLKRHRLADGLSQADLAERARMTAQGVGALERGTRKIPHRDTVRLLADALGLTPDERTQLEATVPRGRSSSPVSRRWGIVDETGTVHAIANVRHPLSPSAIPAAILTANESKLPHQLTSFVGREREILEVRKLLQLARLVTVTGPPGVGKTRLALEVAARLGTTYPDGVFFVPLADVTDPSLVVWRIAQALGVREYSATPAQKLLTDYLREKIALLILDNFEHVVAAAGDVSDLLASCRRLTILATSRAPLRMYGEQEFPVSPLPLPTRRKDAATPGRGDRDSLLAALSDAPSGAPHDPSGSPRGGEPANPGGELALHQSISASEVAEAARSEAIRLFIDRARAVVPDFALNSENALVIAEIGHRLDGLPLAIELAATQIRLLPPDAMLRRLEHRLPLLAGGARNLPVRQQTMRDAIAWSFDLLGEREQVLFARLGVFVGGCTIETAQAVCVADGGLADEVVETIGSLVEKSLVQRQEGARDEGRAEARVRMLEVLREYALDRLADLGEIEAMQERHAAYYVRVAEAARAGLRGRGQIAWLEHLELDLGNVRAALRWTFDHADADTRLRLAGAMWQFWEIRGYLSEGRRWLEEALARGDAASDDPRAQAQLGAGILATCQGDYAPAALHLQAALTIYRARGNRRGVAESLSRLASISAIQVEHAAAMAYVEESLALARDAKDQRIQAMARNTLGYLASLQGDIEGATRLYVESLALGRMVGDRRLIALPLLNLGRGVDYEKDPTRAAGYFQESLALWREVGDRRWSAQAQSNLADIALVQGETAAAGELLAESLATFRDIGEKWGVVFCLDFCGALSAANGWPALAARLLGAADALRGAIGSPLYPSYRIRYQQRLAAARERVSAAEFARAWSEGQALPLNQAIQSALVACRGTS